jgi:hypothetical protein
VYDEVALGVWEARLQKLACLWRDCVCTGTNPITHAFVIISDEEENPAPFGEGGVVGPLDYATDCGPIAYNVKTRQTSKPAPATHSPSSLRPYGSTLPVKATRS